MTCDELLELLLDYVSGELQDDDRHRCEAHLSQCRSCEAYVHSYQVTITITRQLSPPQIPSRLLRRLENLLREELDQQED